LSLAGDSSVFSGSYICERGSETHLQQFDLPSD
jgi:hypothetical protein